MQVGFRQKSSTSSGKSPQKIKSYHQNDHTGTHSATLAQRHNHHKRRTGTQLLRLVGDERMHMFVWQLTLEYSLVRLISVKSNRFRKSAQAVCHSGAACGGGNGVGNKR